MAPEGRKAVKRLHAVVARSAYPRQNVQNTPSSEHFWKLRCRKSAHRCGAKHISKSKCTIHIMFGPLFEVKISKKCTQCTKHTRVGAPLEVVMSKKCTPLWREAHIQVKSTKHTSLGPLLEVEMSKKCTPLWREAHLVLRGRRKGFCTLPKVSKT